MMVGTTIVWLYISTLPVCCRWQCNAEHPGRIAWQNLNIRMMDCEDLKLALQSSITQQEERDATGQTEVCARSLKVTAIENLS